MRHPGGCRDSLFAHSELGINGIILSAHGTAAEQTCLRREDTLLNANTVDPGIRRDDGRGGGDAYHALLLHMKTVMYGGKLLWG